MVCCDSYQFFLGRKWFFSNKWDFIHFCRKTTLASSCLNVRVLKVYMLSGDLLRNMFEALHMLMQGEGGLVTRFHLILTLSTQSTKQEPSSEILILKCFF